MQRDAGVPAVAVQVVVASILLAVLAFTRRQSSLQEGA
jgi:hypothetical protein